MAKKMASTVGPVQNYPFEKFSYEDGSMASEAEQWKTDIKAVMGAVIAQPHEEVDEVHQLDDFYGTPAASNTKEQG